ncbi:hypothetical protein BDN67DRAFT_985112 [Paxillus ammoniavirescens]|nr:hypothetical protein BDN67DRAFT_985112 [Paxillus ammoniavirescens]
MVIGDDADNLEDGVAQSIHAPKRHEPGTNTEKASPTPSSPKMETDTIPDPHSPVTDCAYLRAFQAVANTNRTLVGPKITPFNSGLTQFTPTPLGDFPTIHLSHAAQLFDHISEELLDAWFRVSGPKVLVQPFDYDGKDHFNKMPILTDQIHTTVNTIAVAYLESPPQPPAVKVSPPIAPRGYMQGSPITFLMYNLTNNIMNTLALQRIWSSPTITFKVRPFRVENLPTLLLHLSGFTTADEATVKEAVQCTWDNCETRDIIITIIQTWDEIFNPIQFLPHLKEAIIDFITSVHVERIDCKALGGASTPHFNIFAQSPTSDPMAWTEMHTHLLSIHYPSILNGVGLLVKLNSCSICHSVAHPRGLCPFPSIPAWNGLKQTSAKQQNNAPRGNGKGSKRI